MYLVVQKLTLSFPTTGRIGLFSDPGAHDLVPLVVFKHRFQSPSVLSLQSIAVSPPL